MRGSSPTSSTLAAELLGVLLAYPSDHFAPGELANTLRACPAWRGYLADFETDRGQPAAIGRYLNELGLGKAGHHRTRGSLYSSQAVLIRLQQFLDAARQARAESIASEPPDWEAEATLESAIGPPAAAIDSGPQLIGFYSPGTSTVDRPVDEPTLVLQPNPDSNPESATAERRAEMHSDSPRLRRSSDAGWPSVGGGAAAAPARSTAVIGWRRRATDQTHTPRAAAAAATAAAPLPSPAPYPNYLPGYTGGGGIAPPIWVGASATNHPGAMIPYGGMPEIATPPADDAELPLAFYWIQIRRHLSKILLAAVLVTTLVSFYSLRIPKQYESAVTLRIDFKVPAMLAEANNNPGFDPTTLIQTEVTDVTQRGVILGAIANAHLDRDASLQKQLRVAPAAAPTTANPNALDDALVSLIASQTTAVSPSNTDNIDIHYKSLDPVTSATVANAMAVALITHEFQTRQQEQDDSLKFMTEQFKDVQARMEREQAALTVYQHQNNMLNPEGQGNLETTALNALQSNFLAAQSELTKYQAEEDIFHDGQITDALLASGDGAALRPSYDAWRAAELKFEQVKITRGPANPEYKAAADAVTTTQAALDSASQSVRDQIDIQYQRAKRQEALVRQQLEASRGAAQAFNDKAIDYNAQKRDLDADQKLYDELLAQIKQQQLTTSLSNSGLRVTNLATPNPSPIYPNIRMNVMLALLFSLFCGCGMAVTVGYFDRSFTSPEGIEPYLRIPLLGALPVLANKAHPIELAENPPSGEPGGERKSAPRSAFAESILMLRTAILHGEAQGIRTLSITSAQPQEGKSLILANLAIALALHGDKVLLVDADIRRPAQHRIFEMPNHAGLSSLLRQTAPLDECFRATTVEKLYLMPAGPAVPNPSELMATMLAQVLAPLSAEFDYVLVDSPPLLGFADAMSISTLVEGTLLVARAGKTPRELVHAALQPLKRVRARVLGLVLNQVSSSLSPYYSYYRHHQARYYGDHVASDGEGDVR